MKQADLPSFKQFAQAYRVGKRPFFNDQQPLFLARAPGRLDVMGGIADYSGSLVLEMPIGRATVAAVQPSHARVLEIISVREGESEADSRFVMPLAGFVSGDAPMTYPEAAAYFAKTAASQWAAYVAGVFLVLMREKAAVFAQGARILLWSNVPEGKGVSSSAAVEVATMRAVANAFGLALANDELATLCQRVENRVANAPCGIMDQMTVVYGRKNKLLALLCQPAVVQGMVDIPPALRFWGIDSGIRHAVLGSDYTSVRIGAFMGLKILQTVSGQTFDGYLVNITPSTFEQRFRAALPETILGADFLHRYGSLPDEVTAVDPERTYAVRQPTAHPIYEHFRVQTFARLLRQNGRKNGSLLGELMFQSHASYSACGLGSDGTDRLVELVRQLGPGRGLFGAKISGGGSGGTVVVLGLKEAQAAIDEVAARYEAERGYKPLIFADSSDGAGR